jgi:stage II sporulation protein D
MCQVGAYGMAFRGWTFDRILLHYYTGVEITRME